ncbi:MAG: helix-turn-helix domain-containing protein [Bdellovibrionota bacterium]
MFQIDDSISYYEVLDVRPDASQNEIRQAYLRTKAAYSKDSAALYSLFDEHETRQVLDNIEQAYLVLSNPDKRKEYDKVHGFLHRPQEAIPSPKKVSSQNHVFSFAASSAKSPEDGAAVAQQAAQNVFGAGAESSFEETSSASADTETRPAGATIPAASAAPTREPVPEDYSTPRTLAAATAAGPMAQEYPSRGSFNANENKLGIVRRIDLIKNYDRDPAMEQQISEESAFRGEFFKKTREYKNISIDELSEFTKISKAYINCIESEEFENLPAPAYLRGFLLQIAKALKLPHEKAANAYMAYYRAAMLK